jgi:hypothetical protein
MALYDTKKRPDKSFGVFMSSATMQKGHMKCIKRTPENANYNHYIGVYVQEGIAFLTIKRTPHRRVRFWISSVLLHIAGVHKCQVYIPTSIALLSTKSVLKYQARFLKSRAFLNMAYSSTLSVFLDIKRVLLN